MGGESGVRPAITPITIYVVYILRECLLRRGRCRRTSLLRQRAAGNSLWAPFGLASCPVHLER